MRVFASTGSLVFTQRVLVRSSALRMAVKVLQPHVNLAVWMIATFTVHPHPCKLRPKSYP